jgi:hypothetical protein
MTTYSLMRTAPLGAFLLRISLAGYALGVPATLHFLEDPFASSGPKVGVA